MAFWLPLVATAASALLSKKSADKQAAAMRDAASASQVDINKLDEQTRAIARRNALESAALEKELTPEVPALRTAANRGILNSITGDGVATAGGYALQNKLNDEVGQLQTPLLKAAIAKAQADLGLGGRLSADTKNAVMRKALATSSRVGGGSLGLGRDISARDLGLTSLQLENSRLATALGAGNQERQLGMDNANIQFGNNTGFLNRLQMLKSIDESNFQKRLAAGQYGQSIQQPIVGLDPTAIANVTIGNSNNAGAAAANMANVRGQQSQNWMNAAGNMFGQINWAQAPKFGG